VLLAPYSELLVMHLIILNNTTNYTTTIGTNAMRQTVTPILKVNTGISLCFLTSWLSH